MTGIDIPTKITRLLGIRVPLVQAGMSWASSSPALPLAVSGAGGLGVLAAGPMRMNDFTDAVDVLCAEAPAPFAVNLPLYRAGSDDIIDYLVSHPVPTIIASQGGPKMHLARLHDVGTRWIHVVSTVEHAHKAAAAGVDGLVVVGGEAGGHPPTDLVSTLVVVRAVRKALPDIPLVASGGFADGAGLAAALSLGADAAQFGTRFIASREANVSPSYRQRIVDATIDDTHVVGRDLGVIRMLSNDFSEHMLELERTGAPLDERERAFRAATLKDAALHGDVTTGKVEAGQSAGLVDSIQDAADIVDSIISEYLAVVAALPTAQIASGSPA